VSPIHFCLLLLSAFLLTACSGNRGLESLFAADPKLQPNANNASKVSSNSSQNKLPDNFPQDIPLYPEAKLITSDGNKTIWSSTDPSNLISNFYKQKLKAQNWDISEPEDSSLIATNSEKNQQLKLSFISGTSQTEFSLEYQTKSTLTPNIPEETPDNENIDNPPVTINHNQQLNPQLSIYIQDLVKLGIITPEAETLNPHQIITRREYARWLVQANNTFYANSEGSQIRLASPNSTPIFSDIGPNDPDFTTIQGLAEAGLIPSGLTQDSSAVNFLPDKPLTREDLIAWKVPLDFRKGLPVASLDTIKETWGFQDAASIEPRIWRSLYIDWQNGEQSNLKRAFGYTRLFQPKKPVTLAEVAAVLWYFGYQGEGKSAQQLTSNNQ
jgi:hypothetical protein